MCEGTGKDRIRAAEGILEENCPRCEGKKYVFLGWCSVDTFPMPTGLPDAP
jgi:hypothetical protein